jgi:hypothetical protein
MNMTKSFVQFEDTVTRFEIAALPRKEVDWWGLEKWHAFMNNDTSLIWSRLDLQNCFCIFI